MKKKNITGIILMGFIGLVVWSMVTIQSKERYSDSGHKEYKAGNYQQAIDIYTTAIKSNPDNAFLYNNRALAYYRLKEKGKKENEEKSEEKGKKYDQVISDYTKAIELKPDYKTAYFNRGLTYFKNGSWRNNEPYQKAIEDFSKAIELDPDYVDAYYNRGLAYNKCVHYYNKPFSEEDKAKYTQAIVDFNKVLELDITYKLALAGKANAIYRYGNWTEAEKIYNEALQSEREIVDKVSKKGLAGVYYSRGRNYLNFIDIKKASDDFKQVIQLEPDSNAAFIYLAMINLELEQYEEVIDWANKSIELGEGKKDSYYYSTLGKGYYGLGEYAQAVDNLEKSLNAPSSFGEEYAGKESVWIELGKAYRKKGEKEKAKKEWQKVIRLLNNKIGKEKEAGYRIYQKRGLCYLELEQYQEAIADFKKIISLKEKTDRRVYFWNAYLDAYKQIGIVYSKMGDVEKAREYWQETIKLAEERGNNRVLEKTRKLLTEI
ncbi:tetratricopeptide repeat protein [bacterium]|nr:tetratricopeptide repeat protein [bacterium]